MNFPFLTFMIGVIFIVIGYSFQVRPLCKDTNETRYVSMDEYSDLISNDDKGLINNTDIFDGCERSPPEPTIEELILLSEQGGKEALVEKAKSIKDINHLDDEWINKTIKKIDYLQNKDDLIQLILETQTFARDKLEELDYNKLKDKAFSIKGITGDKLLEKRWNEQTQKYGGMVNFEDYKGKWVDLIINTITHSRCKP